MNLYIFSTKSPFFSLTLKSLISFQGLSFFTFLPPLYFQNNFILGYKKQTYHMEKQKLAEMVMQKMKQKKEQEQRNRPHYEVLRLEVTFAKEFHEELKDSIAELEKIVSKERKTLEELQSHLNEVDNTGKKSLPRIVVMPEFIATENIKAETKDFYRKSSNSFLRTDILRNKGYEESLEQQKKFLESLAIILELQAAIQKNQDDDRRIMNEKRTKVLKEDLRLRSIRQEQKDLRKQIEQEKEDNKQLLKEYEMKKVNLQGRKDRLKYVTEQIEVYKRIIQENYNPISYREHLKSVFAGQIKNQIMRGNLIEVTKKVENVDKETKLFEKHLEKNSSLVVLGRRSDSPSMKLGALKKRLDEERQRKSLIRDRSLGKQISSRSQRSFSQQNSPPQQRFKLDFSTIVQSSGKASLRTTDRSSHRRQLSSLSRGLF